MKAFVVGDFVKVWFDTGAMGATILYGKVVSAGPKQFVVVWESGLKNTIRYSYGLKGIEPCGAGEPDEAAMRRLS